MTSTRSAPTTSRSWFAAILLRASEPFSRPPATRTLSTPAISPMMNNTPTMIAVLLYRGAATAAGACAPAAVHRRGFSRVMTDSMVPSHWLARRAPPGAPQTRSSLWDEAMRLRRCGRRPGGVDRVVRRGHLVAAAAPRKGRGRLPLKWTVVCATALTDLPVPAPGGALRPGGRRSELKGRRIEPTQGVHPAEGARRGVGPLVLSPLRRSRTAPGLEPRGRFHGVGLRFSQYPNA